MRDRTSHSSGTRPSGPTGNLADRETGGNVSRQVGRPRQPLNQKPKQACANQSMSGHDADIQELRVHGSASRIPDDRPGTCGDVEASRRRSETSAGFHWGSLADPITECRSRDASIPRFKTTYRTWFTTQLGDSHAGRDDRSQPAPSLPPGTLSVASIRPDAAVVTTWAGTTLLGATTIDMGVDAPRLVDEGDSEPQAQLPARWPGLPTAPLNASDDDVHLLALARNRNTWPGTDHPEGDRETPAACSDERSRGIRHDADLEARLDTFGIAGGCSLRTPSTTSLLAVGGSIGTGTVRRGRRSRVGTAGVRPTRFFLIAELCPTSDGPASRSGRGRRTGVLARGRLPLQLGS